MAKKTRRALSSALLEWKSTFAHFDCSPTLVLEEEEEHAEMYTERG